MTMHSKIGASSMERWENCPASVALSEGLPNTSSRYADEGTKAHEIAANILNLDVLPGGIDADMLEAINEYVDFIEGLKADIKWIEHSFDLKKLHPNLFGTADAVVWNAKDEVLTVVDFKYGVGTVVEVVNNPQLQYYALGAMYTLPVKPKFIDLVIVQPRAYHPSGTIRTWRTDKQGMFEFMKRLVAAARETENPNAKLIPGSHCKFCKAAGICPELKSKALQTAQQEFSPVESYDPKDLGETLSKIDLIEDWCSSVRAFAYAEANRGRKIPGYKIVAKRSVRKWKEGVGVKNFEGLGVQLKDFLEEPSLKSVAQVEKVLKSHGKKTEILGELAVSASSGFKLVRESEPGVEVELGPVSEFDEIP